MDAVIGGDDAVLDLIPDNSRTSRHVLLGVYRHAYTSRLTDILGNDHPILARHLGEEAFADLARAYIAACPSRHANARWFSQRLPEFIASHAPHASRIELAELAQLERAINTAFDARDAPILSRDDLAKHNPERWGDLRFMPHPSAARIDLRTNAFDIWLALKDGKAPPVAVPLPDRARLIVWRHDVMPTVRPLGPEEAMMWDEATGGTRFSVLCELAATYADPDSAALRAAQYLQTWIASGLLSGAELALKARRRQRYARSS